jgi:hypothetical protein
VKAQIVIGYLPAARARSFLLPAFGPDVASGQGHRINHFGNGLMRRIASIVPALERDGPERAH